MMDITVFIEKQTSLLKRAIEEGTLSKGSPLIHEQKELLIEMLYELATNRGFEKEKGKNRITSRQNICRRTWCGLTPQVIEH